MTPKRPQNDPKRPPNHIETHLGPKKKNRKFSDFGPFWAPKSAKIEKIEKIEKNPERETSRFFRILALSRQIFKKIKFCKKNRKDVPKCY